MNNTEHVIINCAGIPRLCDAKFRVSAVLKGLPAQDIKVDGPFIGPDEPTHVIELSCPKLSDVQEICARLCEAFNQEAVAVWDVLRQQGYLAGPQAGKWGPFKPEMFVMYNGEIMYSPEGAEAKLWLVEYVRDTDYDEFVGVQLVSAWCPTMAAFVACPDDPNRVRSVHQCKPGVVLEWQVFYD